jgi:hypothetical protein
VATKTQILSLTKRIEALAAIRGPQRTIIVAGDETVEQSLQRAGGGMACPTLRHQALG